MARSTRDQDRHRRRAGIDQVVARSACDDDRFNVDRRVVPRRRRLNRQPGNREVRIGLFGNSIGVVPPVDRIRSGAPREQIVPRSTQQHIVARVSKQSVPPIAAIGRVVARRSEKLVNACLASQNIIAAAAIEIVVAIPTKQLIATTALTKQPIVPRPTKNRVTPRPGKHKIIPTIAHHAVIAICR